MATTLSAERIGTAGAVGVDVIERGWNQGDVDAFDRLIAPGYVRHRASLGQVQEAEGFKQLVREVRAGFPDWHVEVLDVVSTDVAAAIRTRATGTHQGDFYGLAPTGKQVSVDSHVLIHVADGRLVEEWEVTDVAGLLAQLGASR